LIEAANELARSLSLELLSLSLLCGGSAADHAPWWRFSCRSRPLAAVQLPITAPGGGSAAAHAPWWLPITPPGGGSAADHAPWWLPITPPGGGSAADHAPWWRFSCRSRPLVALRHLVTFFRVPCRLL